MSDRIKLIIEISEGHYNEIMNKAKYICPTGLERVIVNGTPLDSVKEQISNLSTYKFEIYNLKARVLQILDSIGKADFPQAKDIEPTVKNFSKVLDNKLIKDAIQDCEADMRDKQ